MVLSVDRTIRELCSRITPTSQFSSLHFIASTAIGAKSIEKQFDTGTSHERHGYSATGDGRGSAPTNWRSSEPPPRVFNTHVRSNVDYLTAGATVAAPPPRAAVGGD